MSKKHVQWLYEELPGLIGNGVVTSEEAEKLRRHYGEVETGGGRRWAMIVFGVLGGALIGAGIILLLAHNWEELSRPVRAVISFLPLVIAQALALAVLAKWPGSAAGREGVGTFWTLAIGASIALVAQTYHIGGDFPAFMLTWSLAALPVVYVLRCSTAAMLFWVGVTTWAGNVTWVQRNEVWFWPVAALAVPHLWMMARENRYRPRVGLMLWVLAGCTAVGIGFSLDHGAGRVWVPVFTSYFAVLYILGELWFDEGRSFWQRPLQTVGALGVLVLAIALTFEDVWDHVLRRRDWLALLKTTLIIWPLAALGLWAWMWKRRNVVALLFGGLPVLGVIGTVLGDAGVIVLILANLYVLGLGVALIWLGIRDQRLAVVNLGMLVISALIIARFFDSEMPFVLRGLAFIGVGIGFLVTNMVLVRKKKAAPHPDPLPQTTRERGETIGGAK
jgi:uncharacterized membrane protein